MDKIKYINYWQRWVCIFLFILIVPSSFAEEMTLVTIPLKYQTANTIIPAIKPMMPPGSAISGSDYTLIVRTTEENLAQIRYMLRSLDIPPRMFLISVRQGDATHAQHQTSLSQGVRVYQTTATEDHQDLQSVRVLEGHSAFINAGKSIPVIESVGGFYGDSTGIYYKDVSSGFYVTPRMQAGQVILSIVKQRENLNRDGQGRIKFDQAATTMTVPLGRWVQFAGTSAANQQQRNRIVYQTGDRSNEKSMLYIKVNLVE